MFKLDFMLLVLIFFGAGQIPMLMCARQYDVHTEAIRLYGADLRTVLNNFRRSSDYHKILTQRFEKLKERLRDIALQHMAAYTRLMCHHIYKKYGVSKPYYDRMASKGGRKGVSSRRFHSVSHNRRTDKKNSGVEYLDQHYQVHALEMRASERNQYRDMGFEWAGKILHAIITSMGPDDGPGKSTQLPGGGGEMPEASTKTLRRAGNNSSAKWTASKPQKATLVSKNKALINSKDLSFENESYRRFEDDHLKEISIENEIPLKVVAFNGQKGKGRTSIEFKVDWENKKSYLTDNSYSSSVSLENLNKVLISPTKERQSEEENLNNLYLWEKTTNHFHLPTNHENENVGFGSDGYSGYKKYLDSNLDDETTKQNIIKTKIYKKRAKLKGGHSKDATKIAIKKQWDDETFNFKRSNGDEYESVDISEESSSGENTFNYRRNNKYASSESIIDESHISNYKKWRNDKGLHTKHFHDNWYVDRDQNDRNYPDRSSLELLKQRYKKPEFISKIINIENDIDIISSENFNKWVNNTKRYNVEENSQSNEEKFWKGMLQISKKKTRPHITDGDSKNNTLIKGTINVNANTTDKKNRKSDDWIKNSKENYTDTSLKLTL